MSTEFAEAFADRSIVDAFVHRAADRRPIEIHRAGAGRDVEDAHVRAFADHVASSLRRFADEAPMAGRDLSPSDHGGLGSAALLKAHMTDRLDGALRQPLIPLDFRVSAGSRIVGTPYDVEWQVGGGVAFGARQDGSALTFSKLGFSAAGIGFYLSSPRRFSVAVTPLGGYDFNWFAVENLPRLRSRGGMGVTVYANNDPSPVHSRQPVLWSLSGATKFTGGSGSGRVADAASPPVGFGPVPLAPVMLELDPSVRYLVWVWCWQTKNIDADEFLAFLRFSMPLVMIDAGPPLILK